MEIGGNWWIEGGVNEEISFQLCRRRRDFSLAFGERISRLEIERIHSTDPLISPSDESVKSIPGNGPLRKIISGAKKGGKGEGGREEESLVKGGKQ